MNISVSAASFYDTMGQLGLLEALGKQYDRLVLCLDLYFFTRDESDKGNESPVFMPYADYMLKRLDGMEVSVPKPTAEQGAQIFWKTKLETAFSISYFQSAVAILRANALSNGRGCVVDGDTYPGTYYRHLDCGEVFSKKLRETTASEVAKDIQAYTFDNEWQEHINAYNVEYLDKLIAFLLKKEVDIQLWICPFPPSLWDRFDLKKYPSAVEIEDCVHALGEKYPEIITMGSYDPYRYNLTDADFYDSRHMRLESLEQCFDFTR